MKRSIEAMRRQDLIEAAYRTFVEHGIGGTTVARIGKTAGMSHGLVNYYFKSKSELLNAVVRYANRTIMEDVREKLRYATSHYSRIMAIIDGHFPEKSYERTTANAWISLYAATPKMREFERVHNIYYRRLHSNLVYSLRHFMSDDVAHEAAFGISVMIDGLWTRCGMSRETVRPEEAKRVTRHYFHSLLPDGMYDTRDTRQMFETRHTSE
ncbi:transcriptional regulator BetI [Chromohalobacter japonicus]|uniref:Transcriptional regulator BetI n=1 Tax=Chromohalobacter japonicus TaxID=223900 RepID=A0A1Q8T9I4_9GAMM|nr:transcriptional regulator BetI [Chromohalobacter japonicus]OLO10350.1 transcriptional regulator BetI [Chromohalobacter japonicus]